jgi:hypothetical protein
MFYQKGKFSRLNTNIVILLLKLTPPPTHPLSSSCFASVDGGADRKELMKWWCYVNDFGNQCFNEKSAMVSGETFKKCADDIMAAHQLDVKAVSLAAVAAAIESC